ncbi:MAG: M48 family metallopeptidase [Planctomycetaceae bacterium]|nr:M48 family metallopeptidase [Planctomycetaceae bacterium]
MQLAILIAVICALAQGESSACLPVGGALWRAALTLAGALIAPLAAALGSLKLIRGLARDDRPSPDQCERIWSRIQAIAIGLWLAVVAATMYLIEWPRVVRSDWSLAAWPLVDEILILLPVLVPLVLFWTVMHRLQSAALRYFAHVSGASRPRARLAAFLLQNARHYLALVLLPALVVIGLQETVGSIWPRFSDGWWLYVPVLAAMLILLPMALRSIWQTSPLPDGPLRERLVAICRAQRVGVREILVWHTDGQIANAAVAGVLRGLRYVFLTDALLARLSPAEIEAVLRHELGHITRRHMLLRMLVLALPLVVWLAARQAFPGILDSLSHRLAFAGVSQSLQMSLLVPLALGAYAVLVVGTYSRWLEHDADLATCIWPGGQVDRAAAESFVRALIKIIGPLRESRWSLWLHPSAWSRVAVLARAIADPSWASRYRRRLALFAIAVAACYLATLVLVALA